MPLDFTVLEDDRRRGAISSLGVRQHAALIGQARALGLPLLMRFADFNADAELSHAELPGLARELDRVASAAADADVVAALHVVRAALERAAHLGQPLVALAD
ncbi:hypothetical protein FGE12_23600 [Aggregicoccus sp. 17bor-14]|uniref:hypothetical protein n=1 Tax=Myxococcaceae TaxID=31 RepID=UPI00129D0FDE|nr:MULTISPECIES: hypothetical protein [Myxococcaceae]MBF5045412.1 hypothetical protein [Simulacricoccus sp. 17bor-14]MRI91153.1 hypothetical protein [Aggregicoccus sp. 17bor-14]